VARLALGPIARRLLPLVLVAGALIFFGREGGEVASGEIRLTAGERAAEVRSIDVALVEPGQDDALGTYHGDLARPRAAGELGRWPLRAPAGRYELVIGLETAAGLRTLRRSIELVDGAHIQVDLEADVR
jgi:hypothetical protein